MAANGWSLRDLYRTLEIPGTNRLRDAQAALDCAVRATFGMEATEDTLAYLLHLNQQCGDRESKGQSITAPGFPTSVPSSGEFITSDSMQPNTEG
jgi:hypothetical protein